MNPSSEAAAGLPAKLMLFASPEGGVTYVNVLNKTQTAQSTAQGGSAYLDTTGLSLGMNSVAVFVKQSNVGDCSGDTGTCSCKS